VGDRLGACLIFTPRGEGHRYYEFAGPGTLRKVIAGLALQTEMVPREVFKRLASLVRRRRVVWETAGESGDFASVAEPAAVVSHDHTLAMVPPEGFRNVWRMVLRVVAA